MFDSKENGDDGDGEVEMTAERATPYFVVRERNFGSLKSLDVSLLVPLPSRWR